MKDHFPWLLPILLTLLLSFAQVYELMSRVDSLEERANVTGKKAMQTLADLNYRVEILENYPSEKTAKRLNRIEKLLYCVDSKVNCMRIGGYPEK